MTDKELTDKQEAFVEHYCTDGQWNATKAAQLAGYSPKTAEQQASRLLSKVKVKEAIEDKKTELAANCEITVEQLRKYWLWGMDHAQRTNDLQALARFTELAAKHIGGFEKDNRQKQTQIGVLVENSHERLEWLREQVKLLERAEQAGDAIDIS
jgi:phage terminase small subunit